MLAAAVAAAAILGGCTGSTPAPTTTASPVPNRSRAPVAPILRGSGAVDLGLKWNTFLTAPLSYAQQLGWGETFTEVEWCAVRDLAPGRQFGPTDRALQQARGFGFGLMIKLRVGDCTGAAEVQDPAEGLNKHPSTYPDDPGRYRAFIDTMVRRYQPQGVRAWAIENEVDAANFWSGTGQQYADTAKLVADAVRAADPKAIILDAGISSTGYGVAMSGDLLEAGRPEEALALYRAYYARRHGGGGARFGPAASVDDLRRILADQPAVAAREMVAANWEVVNSGAVSAYQLHFYEDPRNLPTLLQYIDNHLTAAISIEAWEVGVAWPGAAYTEAGHADDLARLVATLLTRRISPIVYLPLAFTPRAGKEEIFRGLVSPQGQVLAPGRVWARFAAAAKTSTDVVALTGSIDGSAAVGALVVGPGGSLAAAWTSTGPVRLLDLPGGREAAVRGLAEQRGVRLSPN